MKTTFTLSKLATVRDEMVSICNDRHNKYQVSVVEEFADVRNVNERVFMGNFSYTYATSKQRKIIASGEVSTLANKPQTASEIARDYLDVCYPHRLRCTGQQREEYILPRSIPLYYQPFVSKDAIYLDIKSTYWAIQQVVGWNVDYMPGKFLSPGRAPYDFPLPDNKIARNCLVSAGLSNKVTVWTGNKFIETSPYNHHLNLGLYTLICDVLNCLASEAISCGAHYVNTDGYILPSNRSAEMFERFAYWGLPLHVKAVGETLVTGIGSYIVGDKKTKAFYTDNQNPYCNIYPVKRPDMLRKTMHMIAKDRVDRPGLFEV